MITDPDECIEAFAEAAPPASSYAEVLPHLHRTLSAIRSLKCRAGVAITTTRFQHSRSSASRITCRDAVPGFGGSPLFVERGKNRGP
jgi:pentose-5-phosphate-3-epimerase